MDISEHDDSVPAGLVSLREMVERTADHRYGPGWRGTIKVEDTLHCPDGGFKIKPHGGKAWAYNQAEGAKDAGMYQNEHNELIASIRAGKPINNGDYMCKSTLMAIMGRMATYTGQEIHWDKALNSKQDLSPAKYEFGDMAVPEVAKPGVTKFV